MNLTRFKDHEELSQFMAGWLTALLRSRPESLLCLATGATPLRSYELLADSRLTEPARFDRVKILQLDEWGGLEAGDPATCEHHLRQSLIDVLGLGDRYFGFVSNPVDPQSECHRVALWLEQNGPIDVCVLGLGTNGHLGFNEPAPELHPHAHVARLSASSLGHSMLDRAQGRPTFGLTLGMADLLQSRRIVLLVSGPTKEVPLRRLLNDPIRTDFPASFLKLHPDVTILCDEASYPEP